jgi:hypothetical protein
MAQSQGGNERPLRSLRGLIELLLKESIDATQPFNHSISPIGHVPSHRRKDQSGAGLETRAGENCCELEERIKCDSRLWGTAHWFTMAHPADKDKIEFLVRRRFRHISTAPPPFAQGVVSVRMSNERIARKHPSVREAMDAYRTKLQAMTPEEIGAMYETERSRQEQERIKDQEELRAEAEKRERDRFFNQPSAMADVNHWSKAAYWTLDEATALSLGRAPRW